MAERSLFEVRLLGGIEVTGHDGAVAPRGSRKQRALLAILSLARGHAVSADRLVDELWGGEPPSQALASLYPYVSNLRRILEPSRDVPPSVLVTVPPGYALRLPDGALDIVRFEHAAREVSTLVGQRHWTQVRERSEVALSWWHGAALEEFASEPFAQLEAARLEELRLVLLEDLFEARVEMNDGQVTADLERFVGAQPLRERGWGLLMRSLYAGGRQSEALRAYQRARTHLRDELGVEPGPQLRDLEASILRHDAQLDPDAHRRAAVPSGRPTADVVPAKPGDIDQPADTDTTLAGSRLIGRDQELSECRQVLDEIAHGPRAIIAEGEPGIGKTRLVEEIADLAGSRDMVVLWGRSLDGSTTPAFWPWLPVLRRLAGLDHAGPALDHELDSLLSPSPSATETTVGPARFVLFDQIVALIERVARRHHLMIALDDLQWADVASLELVVTLATRLSRPGVLLAVTTRELDVGRNDAQVAALAALTRMTGSRRLQLTGLDHADTTELLTALTGRPTDPATASVVLSRAEGNPFFTTELGRLLAVANDDAAALDQIAVTIRDVIVHRLAPMPPATLELLRLASVIGREFNISTVANAMQFADVLDCLEVLEPAVLQRLVIHIDDHPGTYRFTHGLVSDVLVHDQTAGPLAAAHLRVADALHHSDDTAEIIAEHLWAAAPLADARRTASQLERAAGVAISRGAYEAAQHHLERAMTLYRSADPADALGRGRTLNSLSSVSVFSRSSIASELLDPPDRRSGIHDDEAGRVALRLLEFYSLNVACDFAAADPIARELRALAEVTSDPLIRSSGHSAYGCSSWYHGRLPDATWHLDRAIEAMARVDGAAGAGPIDAIQMSMPHVIRCHVQDLMGQLDDPESAAENVRHTLRGDRLWSVIVSDFSCLGAFMVGDHERALREAERAIELDPDADFARWSAAILAYRLTARCAGGDAPLGRRALRKFARTDTVGNNRTTMSIIFATLALGLARHGDAADAADAAVRARAQVDPYTDLYTEPLVLAAEAAVATARQDGADVASRLLDRALVITERQGARAVGAHVIRVAKTLGHEMSTA